MTTMQRDPLVAGYLRRLEAAAAGLPRERRRELVAEIEEHIDAALGEEHGEAAVRTVLDRLGTPEEIAAAAGPPAVEPTRGTLETMALVVLAVSFLVPLLGYLVGAALVVASRAWTEREKLIGLVLPPLVVAATLLVLFGVAGASSQIGPLEAALILVNPLAGLAAAAYLASRLNRRSPAA
jgi:uncharacterized membrane protein